MYVLLFLSGGILSSVCGALIIDCGTPIPDAGYTLGAITTTYDGSSVFYSCASGYLGSGGMTVCEADGTWVEFSGCEGKWSAAAEKPTFRHLRPVWIQDSLRIRGV